MSVVNTTDGTATAHKRSRPLSTSMVTSVVALVDAAALFGSGLLVFLLYTSALDSSWAIQRYPSYLMVITTNMVATLTAFQFSNLYSRKAVSNPGKHFSKIVFTTSMVFLFLLFFGFTMQISAEFSRGWALCWVITNPLALLFSRLLFRKYLLAGLFKDKMTRNVAIVGGGSQGSHLASLIENNSDSAGMKIFGIFDERSTRSVASKCAGNLDDLVLAVRNNKVDDILVALPWTAEDRVAAILNKFRMLPVSVRLSPDYVGLTLVYPNFSFYNGIPVLKISDEPLSGWDKLAKSTLDIVVSSVSLVILSPLFLIIAIAIKLETPGSIFFRQKRPGFNNELIEVLKFRSLHENQHDNSGSRQVNRHDSRVTRVGKFLRRTSLDEIPQLINVLKGEMSLVGPRPHPVEARAAGELYEKVVSDYAGRHIVKPGITGWAQINGWRGETDTEEKLRKRVEHDFYYISNWSLITDIKIILLTIPAVLRGRGAF